MYWLVNFRNQWQTWRNFINRKKSSVSFILPLFYFGILQTDICFASCTPHLGSSFMEPCWTSTLSIYQQATVRHCKIPKPHLLLQWVSETACNRYMWRLQLHQSCLLLHQFSYNWVTWVSSSSSKASSTSSTSCYSFCKQDKKILGGWIQWAMWYLLHPERCLYHPGFYRETLIWFRNVLGNQSSTMWETLASSTWCSGGSSYNSGNYRHWSI